MGLRRSITRCFIRTFNRLGSEAEMIKINEKFFLIIFDIHLFSVMENLSRFWVLLHLNYIGSLYCLCRIDP